MTNQNDPLFNITPPIPPISLMELDPVINNSVSSLKIPATISNTALNNMTVNSNLTSWGITNNICSSQSYYNKKIETTISYDGIISTINNNNNALIMLEVIKEILISKNIVSNEEFNKLYKEKLKNLEDIKNAHDVMEKLSEKPY